MPDFVRPLNLKKPVVNRKLIAWGFILTGLISIGGWAVGRFHTQSSASSKKDVAVEKESGNSWWGPVKISFTITPPTPNPVGQAVISKLQAQLGEDSGSYGIYVYRLSDKVGYGLNADHPFPATSIMKVPIMVATYRQVESGQINLVDVQDDLEAIGIKSDNDAPVALTNLVGRDFIHQTINDLGMAHSDFDQNLTTAFDLGVMWKNLYEGKLISPEHWQQMQKFLTGSFFEDRIPAGIPSEVTVVHKVGTDLDKWADSGIVLTAKPFVISILNDQVDQIAAKDLVPQLVQTIYAAETATQ